MAVWLLGKAGCRPSSIGEIQSTPSPKPSPGGRGNLSHPLLNRHYVVSGVHGEDRARDATGHIAA